MIIFVLQLTLVLSFIGILIIIFRKISLLSQIQVSEEAVNKREYVFNKAKEKIRSLQREKIELYFTKLLQKMLHRLRIWSLRVENISAKRLRKMQERTREIEKKQKEDFWENLKG